MCGIYGIAFVSTKKTKASVIRSIIRKLAIASQARGTHATGLSFASKKGITLFKHNVSARKFLTLENANKAIRDGVDFSENSRVYSMIGHTRYQTQGTHRNPDNNHPIKTGSIVGVHNGSIINDDEIFKYLESKDNDDIKRIAQVDSEAIFAYINHVGKVHKFPNKMVDKNLVGNTGSPITAAIKETVPEITGSLACAMQDADNPKSLWIFRKTNPVVVLYYRQEGLVIFASDKLYIQDAVAGLKFSRPEEIVVNTYSGICINLEDNTFARYEIDPVAKNNTMYL